MTYWDLLADAAEKLEARSFAEAESLFAEASRQRERSPGRVFLTEKVGDGVRRLLGGLGNRAAGRRSGAGRWHEATAAFRRRFARLGAAPVGAAVRLGDFLPEGGAPENQAVLVGALHLLVRSDLFEEDLAAAVPLLKATFRTALRTGKLFNVALIRHDLPLTEEDRLWLARKGDTLLGNLFAEDAPEQVRYSRQEWGRVLVQLIQPEFFSSAGRLEEERHWFEALLTDQYLEDPLAALVLYRDFVRKYRQESERVAAARVRLVELPGNVGGFFFPVPLYGEVDKFLGAEPAPAAREAAQRFAAARRIIAWRRPAGPPGLAWASVAATGAGKLVFVFWWGRQPRDVACWEPGQDWLPLREFLAPCGGRVVWAGTGLTPATVTPWPDGVPGLPLQHFAIALLEAELPPAGLTRAAEQRLAMSQAAAWRTGWDWRRGHPWLSPPRPSSPQPPDRPPGVAEALTAGLVWLACLARVRRADPCLRQGLSRLAGSGDPAARFLATFLEPESSPANRPDQGSARWPLPPLLSRPDPLTPVSGRAPVAATESGPRPDLTGNDVAVVCTGNPAAVLSAWGSASGRWRVVLDSRDRLEAVAPAVAAGGGLLSLVPSAGKTHDPAAALRLLDELLDRPDSPAGGDEMFLPLFHWIRLVETHNGDLLDFLAVRPHAAGVVSLFDRYVALVAKLPRSTPAAPGEGVTGDPDWSVEFVERAWRSRLVVGLVDQLSTDPEAVDSLWGVRPGCDASWVFCDSPSVHWRLLRTAQESSLVSLHQVLAARGQRHLSVVLGGLFLREELEELLGAWLAPYGSPYFLALTDTRCAFLHLAAGGIDPDARVLCLPAARSQVDHLQELAAQGEHVLVLAPEEGPLAELWADLAEGRLLSWPQATPPTFLNGAEFWSANRRSADWSPFRLVVPALASLAGQDEMPVPPDDPAEWRETDHRRRAAVAAQRKLCSLEVNALLASGVAAVDLADPRWWRRFPFPVAGQADLFPRSGEEAIAVAAPGGATGYDLPDRLAEVPAGRGTPVSAPPLESAPDLATWLRERGWIGEDGLGHVPGLPRPRQPGPAAVAEGVWLQRGPAAAAWASVALRVASERERGNLGCLTVLVGPRPPAGAAALLATYPSAGRSVLPADSPRGDERVFKTEGLGAVAPLLWLDLADLGRPAWQAELTALAPDTLFADDLTTWLPAPQSPALDGAAALLWLARSGIPRVLLFTAGLPAAWGGFLQRFWAEEVGKQGRILPAALDRAPVALPAAGEPLALGRLPGLERTCLACGAAVPVLSRPVSCPACGLDVDLWFPVAFAEDQTRRLLRAKLEALAGRTDLGHGEPLRVWLRPAAFSMAATLLAELGVACRRDGDSLRAELADNRRWVLAAVGGRLAGPGPIQQAILFPPAEDLSDVASLVSGADSVSLWIHPSELARSAVVAPAEKAYRCQALLTADLSRLAAGWWEDQEALPAGISPKNLVLPFSQLRLFSGLSGAELMESLNVLRWIVTLRGEKQATPSPGRTDGDGPLGRLLVRWPFAEIEFRLRSLEESLAVLLPLLLATTRTGVPTYCDLGALPARIPDEHLHWLDGFLLASSGRLSFREPPVPPAAAAPVAELTSPESQDELLYEPPAGTLFSTRRRVGYLGSVQGVTSRLRHHLDLFLASVKMLLAEADPAGGHYVVDLPRESTELPGQEVIELGCLLGLWSWCEAPSEVGLPLADLQALGRSACLRERPEAAALLTDLAAARDRWEDHLRQSQTLGLLEAAAPTAGESERALPTPGPPEEVAGRIRALAHQGSGRLLVLRGPAGCGRQAAVVTGLAGALADGLSVHSVTIVCPDRATAARVHLAWRREIGPRQPPILLADDPGLPAGSGAAESPAGTLTVLAEAQRIRPEERYRLCQNCRSGLLVATLDTGELQEPWDHVFLTTPLAEDVVDLPDQRRQARRIWAEVQKLAPDAAAVRGKSARRQKGECRSQWAGNLDECLSCLESEQEQGGRSGRLALVAPTLDDLTYLGRRLVGRGWKPVFRQELEYLLLPGPLEFVAAVTDLAPPADEKEVADQDPGGLLAWLLPSLAREDYLRWRRRPAGQVPAANLREFFDNICRTHWAASFLTHRQARRRVEKLVSDVGEETAARFRDRPLWEAWRHEIAALAGAPVPPLRGPFVTLASSAAPTGSFAESLVYLCRGTEPGLDHYRVMSRATDSLLVLYHDLSPLPSEAAAEGG